MPSPATTDLPRPSSWDELEDICSDLLRVLWKDPLLSRNGRSGQKQDGVDIIAQPANLGGPRFGRYSGAQCKNTDRLTIADIRKEVELAKAFKPPLKEYVVMTTAAREATLQEAVRLEQWPFPVRIMFWEDISLALSGEDALLQKHFPGWAKARVSIDHVLEIINRADSCDFQFNDETGVYLYRHDVSISIKEARLDGEHLFNEPWVRKFSNPRATAERFMIMYNDAVVKEVCCAIVDGGRHIIPYPASAVDLTITHFQYKLARIVNHHINGYGIDYALTRAGITVLAS